MLAINLQNLFYNGQGVDLKTSKLRIQLGLLINWLDFFCIRLGVFILIFTVTFNIFER
jgi:hypothetical protein